MAISAQLFSFSFPLTASLHPTSGSVLTSRDDNDADEDKYDKPYYSS